MMKRLILTVVMVLMIMGIPVISKAQGRDVTITDADGASTGVTISGTTDAYAVMVQIRDSGNHIVTMASFPVVNNEFSGTISQSLTAGADYTIFVADYEGGTFSTETVTATQASNPGSSTTPSSSGTNTSESSDLSEAETPVLPPLPEFPQPEVPVTPVQPVTPTPAVTPVAPEKPEATEADETPVSTEKPAVVEEE